MNLKEAFQMQNKINSLILNVQNYLSEKKSVVTVKEKHFRSKAVEGQADEILNMTEPNNEKFPANKMIEFLLKLIDVKEKLSEAINHSKRNMNFDLDAAVDINKKRHEVIETFNQLIDIQSSSEIQKNKGIGYVFNNEGNQVEYRYDIERIQTIDFDRNKLRRITKGLYKKSDEVSTQIDFALLNTNVNYEVPFDMNGEIWTIIEDYVTDEK